MKLFTRRRVFTIILAMLIFALPALAEDIYIRNKPFKGAVSGSGNSTMVELDTLLKLLDAEIDTTQDPWQITMGEDSFEATPAQLEAAVFDGVRMVNLKAFAEVIGAKLTASPELGTLDLAIIPGGKSPGKGPMNLIVNGNFHDSPDPKPDSPVPTGTDSINGWDVERRGPYIGAARGYKFVHLGAGRISQTIYTEPGRTYVLTLLMYGKPGKTLNVDIGGAKSGYPTNGRDQRLTKRFVAKDAKTVIRFSAEPTTTIHNVSIRQISVFAEKE